MLFKQKHLEGIKAGKISLAFRKWKKLSVKKGDLIKTEVGIIKIGNVTKINPKEIIEIEAVKAGFASAQALISLLEGQKDGGIYRIEVSCEQEDELVVDAEMEAEIAAIDPAELAEISLEIQDLDQASKVGRWTVKTLQAIQQNPNLKSADLAVILKKEKEWLKLNVRKLRALGLTESHEPGYSITALGIAFLRSRKSK
jgi:hypothetical protein